ncbi:MAG TPA: hypothetical protein VMZ91_14030, partial [Candidatus Paceibacterota bacterium]|nr:hypothetical protein [Candidatus Paceibacterota bacterium]
MNKLEIGIEFEKEAFKFLKKKFNDVKWLSKHKRSTFDFLCDGKYVEAKCNMKSKRPYLYQKQYGCDYIIFKNNIGTFLIPKDEFEGWGIKTTIKENRNINIKNTNGLKKRLKKWGNNLVLVFTKEEEEMYG